MTQELTLKNLTIAYLKEQYLSNTFAPEDVVRDILFRSSKFADKNIWISQLSFEQINEYIVKLDKSKISEQPLWGIPFAIKDNIDLAGIPTTAACQAFSYVPNKHAFVVEQLISAGAIPIGKTNMDQFATGLVGVRSPEKWGVCKNAFDDNVISGGSSSGSAVAVALGLASFSLGTDTAGSGRVPAALNNIIGLKPSKGLLSCSGVVPACKSLDCVSIFATTADDTDKVFGVAAQFDENDPYSRANKDTNLKNFGQYNKPFNFAVPKKDQLNFFGNKAMQNCFEKSVEQLEASGGTKTEIDFLPFLNAAKLLYEGPWVAERYLATKDILSKQPDAVLPVIKNIIESKKSATAADAFSAFYQLQEYKQQADLIINQFDFVLTPTVGTSYQISEVQENPIELNSNLGFYTNYMNLLDYCAIAIPAGFSESGIPFGISLVSTAFSDTKLLSFAKAWLTKNQEYLGATEWLSSHDNESSPGTFAKVELVVCGAHLEGLPLNWQLLDRDAYLVKKTTTSNKYRLFALSGGPPFRPGLIRDEENGSSIEVEIWELNTESLGSFLANIPPPLGLGKVELEDGSWKTSFICEGYAIESAQEITHLGGWRAFISKNN